jgi:hypothetical protein
VQSKNGDSCLEVLLVRARKQRRHSQGGLHCFFAFVFFGTYEPSPIKRLLFIVYRQKAKSDGLI